jgi:hypothetical protein
MLYGSSKPFQKDTPAIIADKADGIEAASSVLSSFGYGKK